ncbi:hypothetical protein [Actinophytocola gossypii]|uniref:DUF385 domain-containing protein n=1 Tax=Actinophytocola gossypii TaxID=2812003 RepID=A0ABT2J5H6_9PSEU|nr:hypothetical protein [Actinophytocola gossypii]MCT2582926.1 hypothetical protein [Actinophytocola gossypii]
MTLLQRVARIVNRAVLPAVSSPRLNRLTSGRMTVVRYTGRRSGRAVSLPVAYRSERDRLTIDVSFPDKKTWWRNFTGDGAPLTVRLDGIERPGQATAVRDGDRVRIEVTLNPPDSAPPTN